MKVYIGYDNFQDRLNHHNGAPPNVDYLHHDGFYQVCKEDIDFTEVDVHNHDGDYIFPINAKYGDTKVLSKENFFGKYISDKVISDLRQDKCLLHLNWVTEAYRYKDDDLDSIKKFLDDNNISYKNILISSDNFVNHNYDLNILGIPIAEKGIECDNNYIGFKRLDSINKGKRDCKLYSVGRTPHQHRLDLVDFFETEKFTDEEVLYSALWKDKRIDEKYHWPESGESGTNHGSNDYDITSYDQNPYNHVYCEIVTETIFDNSATQISDKPYKPILNYLPFIYVTSFGGLNDLKSMGYESFDFIDESYDDIKDCSKRLEKIKKEILRFAKIDKNELHYIYNSNIPTFLHNREVYLKNNTTRIKGIFESIIDGWKNNEKCLSITNKLPTRS